MKRADWRADHVELVRLVSLGLRNKEIAGALGISETAVKKRLMMLMQHADVDSRVALVRVAFAQGVINIESDAADMRAEGTGPHE